MSQLWNERMDTVAGGALLHGGVCGAYMFLYTKWYVRTCYELWLASCFCMLPCTLCMCSAARTYTRNTSVSLRSPFLLIARRNKAYAHTYVPRLRQGAWLYPR